jgi:hypothetical protein
MDRPYGRPSLPGDYALENPPMLGTQRTGPGSRRRGLAAAERGLAHDPPVRSARGRAAVGHAGLSRGSSSRRSRPDGTTSSCRCPRPGNQKKNRRGKVICRGGRRPGGGNRSAACPIYPALLSASSSSKEVGSCQPTVTMDSTDWSLGSSGCLARKIPPPVLKWVARCCGCRCENRCSCGRAARYRHRAKLKIKFANTSTARKETESAKNHITTKKITSQAQTLPAY